MYVAPLCVKWLLANLLLKEGFLPAEEKMQQVDISLTGLRHASAR